MPAAPAPSAPPLSPFINGESVGSASMATHEVIDPSTGKHLVFIPRGCDADADRAVQSARGAFESGVWSESAPSSRKRALRRLSELVAAHAPELDSLDAAEMGKPVSERRANAQAASGLIEFYAEAIGKVAGDVYDSDKTTLVLQRRVPRGVVGAIVPWNFPTYNAALKLAPALAAGNCVVLKPSELSSRSALLLARLALEAGVPPGVLNVVPGLGASVGEALALHSDVDMITFTGSTAVGKRMLEYAGRSNMKAVMTECGGKSPHIVFDDGVDLESAADAIAALLLTNQGQICSVGSRLLVQRRIAAALIERIVARFGAVKPGNALDPTTTFGPLASARQLARVRGLLASALESGGDLISGGNTLLGESGGYFFAPTLMRVKADNPIASEEVFGPVLAVIPFDDAEEAVTLANGTPYGLAAYVWTGQLATAMRVAKALRSTAVINAVAPIGEGAGHAASAEPAGASGLGTEGGLAGMESYLRRQLVWFNH